MGPQSVAQQLKGGRGTERKLYLDEGARVLVGLEQLRHRLDVAHLERGLDTHVVRNCSQKANYSSVLAATWRLRQQLMK